MRDSYSLKILITHIQMYSQTIISTPPQTDQINFFRGFGL